jgi:hypothetical protein
MATNRNDITNKFKDGMTPPEGDFKEIFDNFVHKEDKATIDMIDAGIDDERYVTPALLRVGLQNAGVISGGSILPFKEYKNNFNESSIHLERLAIESSVKVFKNGQLLQEGEDYTINYETAVVSFPELVGFRNIEIDYWYKSTEPIPGNGTNYVDLTTNQTISGIKSFATGINIPDPILTDKAVVIENGIIKMSGQAIESQAFIKADLVSDNRDIQLPDASGTVALISDIPTVVLPPFAKANDSFYPRERDSTQFGPIGDWGYDFSDANIGAFGDIWGQVGQIGVHPAEKYGALGTSCYAFGYNLSVEGYGDTVFGMYNHSDVNSQFSTMFGRNNYNNSYHSIVGGSFNNLPYTYLGHKTVFGQGNMVQGTAGLTSGVALLNKSFGTTVLGQANTDYSNTEQGVNDKGAPILIIGNGSVNVPVGLWTAATRSDAFIVRLNGSVEAPSLTNALINADTTGKSLVTKEYIALYSKAALHKEITAAAYTILPTDLNYTIFFNSASPVTVTLNEGLPNNFECDFYNLGAGTVSFVSGTATISKPDGASLAKDKVATLIRVMSTANYKLKGELV